MGRIQRTGGVTANKPSPMLEREEYIDIQQKIKHIGLPDGAEMSFVNTEPGTAEKPFLKWNESTKRYEKVSFADIFGYAKKYVAKVTQTGTEAPTAVVLHNTLGIAPTLTRNAAGSYQIDASNTFPLNKTIVKVIPDHSNNHNNIIVQTGHNNVGYIVLETLTGAGELTDELLDNATVEIEVYP